MPCILTRCRAFLLPRCNTVPYKRLQRVLCNQCNYTNHATKQHTVLCIGFSCDYARSTAHDTRPTKADIIPPATRWRAYTRPDALNRYQIPPPRRDAAQVNGDPSIIIMYIIGFRDAPCYGSMPDGAAYRRPCQRRRVSVSTCTGSPGGVSMLSTPGGWRSGTGSAVRAGSLAPSTRRGSPAAGARQAARNHWRLPPHLFSGCRPIANRGQQ